MASVVQSETRAVQAATAEHERSIQGSFVPPPHESRTIPGRATPPAEAWIYRHGQLIAAIASGILLLVAAAHAYTVGHHTPLYHWLIGISFVLGFYFGARATWESLREGSLDINLLMVVGAVLAVTVDKAPEGALLLFLFTLSGALEHYAMQRTEAAIAALTKLFPKEAIVLDADGTQRTVELEKLQIGDRILVKPGENVAADGTVVEGQSALNEAAITGEFLPRDKGVGASVFAGTLNTTGRLVVRVDKPAQDTTLALIIHLVSQAREEKAPVERLFDRVGTAYTIFVFSTSLIAMLVLHYVMGLPWTAPTGQAGQGGAIYRAITLLIVASPCALIISTPVVILSAIASCARRGIVLKGGKHLESLATVQAMVFDKTGTLTTGQVQLMDVEYISAPGQRMLRGMLAAEGDLADAAKVTGDSVGNGQKIDPAQGRQMLLKAAVALEANSTHPLAEAVVRFGHTAGVAAQPVQEFVQEPGHGLRGLVDGQMAIIGSPQLIKGLCPTTALEKLTVRIAEVHKQGHTAVVMYYAGHAGLLCFRDTVRPESRDAIRRLHDLGVRPLVMLTGDNKAVAEAVAGELGLDEVRAELLPQDKLHAVQELAGKHTHVAMIGDGINDAPALARATVGIAMGSIGSDAALQAADVVLLSDRLDRVPWLIAHARRARRVMAQNLAFAILVILTLIVLSLMGTVTLPLGVVGHEGSTLLVVFNGLRLLRARES